MTFPEWLKDFMREKKYLGGMGQPEGSAVFGIQRYVDDQGTLWEYGFTYTNRLVTRSSIPDSHGQTLTWTDWQTLHHVVGIGDGD